MPTTLRLRDIISESEYNEEWLTSLTRIYRLAEAISGETPSREKVQANVDRVLALEVASNVGRDSVAAIAHTDAMLDAPAFEKLEYNSQCDIIDAVANTLVIWLDG